MGVPMQGELALSPPLSISYSRECRAVPTVILQSCHPLVPYALLVIQAPIPWLQLAKCYAPEETWGINVRIVIFF